MDKKAIVMIALGICAVIVFSIIFFIEYRRAKNGVKKK